MTFACSLDGAGLQPCTSPFNVLGLAQGAHTFAVAAIDAAGHQDPSPATASWTVDTVPPDIALGMSLLRRAKDLAIGVPVLLVWQFLEVRRLRVVSSSE